MKKTIKAWALSAPQDPIVLWAIADTKAGVSRRVERDNEGLETPIEDWYKEGYRIKRITISWED